MCAACGILTHIPDIPGTTGATTASPGARFAALKNPDCRTYLGGAMLSMMGDFVEHVITYWVIFERFNSPALSGFAVIAHWVPALFSVYFGGLADRYDCRKVIQASQLLFMSVSAIWGILFITNSLQVWHCVALLVMHGIASALWGPGEQLMLHDIVGTEELPSAIRLNATFKSLGMLAGPAVGAALLFGFGPALGIFVNILLYVPLTTWLVRAPYTGHLRDVGGYRRPALSMVDAVRVMRDVAGNPVLVSMVALGGVASFFIGTGLQPLMPLFARDLGTADAGLAYGMLLSANAAGAVIGGFALEASGMLKPNARTAMWCTVTWGLLMVGFALSQSYLLSIVLLIVAGVANLASMSISQTLVQLLAPPEQRGRVVGVYNMASSGLRAGSGVTLGIIGGVVGVHLALATSGVALAVLVGGLMIYTARAAARLSSQFTPGLQLTP